MATRKFLYYINETFPAFLITLLWTRMFFRAGKTATRLGAWHFGVGASLVADSIADMITI
jgi:hypothetical protein